MFRKVPLGCIKYNQRKESNCWVLLVPSPVLDLFLIEFWRLFPLMFIPCFSFSEIFRIILGFPCFCLNHFFPISYLPYLDRKTMIWPNCNFIYCVIRMNWWHESSIIIWWYHLAIFKNPLNYIINFYLPGIPFWSKESSCYEQHQYETVCKPYANSDWCQVKIQAIV
jgi:hypothetical protein